VLTVSLMASARIPFMVRFRSSFWFDVPDMMGRLADPASRTELAYTPCWVGAGHPHDERSERLPTTLAGFVSATLPCIHWRTRVQKQLALGPRVSQRFTSSTVAILGVGVSPHQQIQARGGSYRWTDHHWPHRRVRTRENCIQ
jgi:hypothetical protein